MQQSQISQFSNLNSFLSISKRLFFIICLFGVVALQAQNINQDGDPYPRPNKPRFQIDFSYGPLLSEDFNLSNSIVGLGLHLENRLQNKLRWNFGISTYYIPDFPDFTPDKCNFSPIVCPACIAGLSCPSIFKDSWLITPQLGLRYDIGSISPYINLGYGVQRFNGNSYFAVSGDEVEIADNWGSTLSYTLGIRTRLSERTHFSLEYKSFRTNTGDIELTQFADQQAIEQSIDGVSSTANTLMLKFGYSFGQ